MSRKIQTGNRQREATNHFAPNHLAIRAFIGNTCLGMAYENVQNIRWVVSIRWPKSQPPRSGFSWRLRRQPGVGVYC